MRRHKLLPARGKGGNLPSLPLSCAGPGLKGSRERASAEGLGASGPPLPDPPARPPPWTSAAPKGPRRALFALWSNKNSGQTDVCTCCLMFSLKSWPEAFNNCKTAAEINHITLC